MIRTPRDIVRSAKHRLRGLLAPAKNDNSQYHLIFGDYPDIKRELISVDDPAYHALEIALRKCRSFNYDVQVFRNVEPECRFLPVLTRTDKISLDIGANVGFYSAMLSPLSSKVFAWEANPHMIPYITNNVSRFGNVHVLPLAAGKEKGNVVFNVPLGAHGDILSHSGSGGMSNAFMTKMNIKSMPVHVPLFPVDTFGFQNVGFMKIDVEGSEHDVLQGAAQTIETCRPAIEIENEYRHNPECGKVFDFLKARSYVGYFFDRKHEKLCSFDQFSLEKNQIAILNASHEITDPKGYVYNFLFVPSEGDPLKPYLGKRGLI